MLFKPPNRKKQKKALDGEGKRESLLSKETYQTSDRSLLLEDPGLVKQTAEVCENLVAMRTKSGLNICLTQKTELDSRDQLRMKLFLE